MGFVLCLIFNTTIAHAQRKDSIVNFIFTSDVHFGLTKEEFRGKNKVPAIEINKAMVQAMDTLSSKSLKVAGIDALIITGDVANRMENGVQSATESWKQFKEVYIDSNRLQKTNGAKSEVS